MVTDVEKCFRDIFYSKPDQVRVEQWLKKLCENCCERVPLMKNRNKYMNLLHVCIFDIKRLEGIFRKMPPTDGEDLKIIQNHEILDIEQFAHKAKRQMLSQKRAQGKYTYNQNKAKYAISLTKQKQKEDQQDNYYESSRQNQNPKIVKAQEWKDFTVRTVSWTRSPHNKKEETLKSHTCLCSQEKQLNNKNLFTSAISPITKKKNEQFKNKIVSPQQKQSQTPLYLMKRQTEQLLMESKSKSLVNLHEQKADLPNFKEPLLTNPSIDSSDLSTFRGGNKFQQQRRSRADRMNKQESRSVSAANSSNDSINDIQDKENNKNKRHHFMYKSIPDIRSQQNLLQEAQNILNNIPQPNNQRLNKRTPGFISKNQSKIVTEGTSINISQQLLPQIPQINIEWLDHRRGSQSTSHDTTIDEKVNRDLDVTQADEETQDAILAQLNLLRQETLQLLSQRDLILSQ